MRHPTLTSPSPHPTLTHPVEQGPQGEGDSLDSFMKELKGTLSKSAKYEARQKIHHLRKVGLGLLALCALQGAPSIPHLHTSCLPSLPFSLSPTLLHLPTSPPSSLSSYLSSSLPPPPSSLLSSLPHSLPPSPHSLTYLLTHSPLPPSPSFPPSLLLSLPHSLILSHLPHLPLPLSLPFSVLLL